MLHLWLLGLEHDNGQQCLDTGTAVGHCAIVDHFCTATTGIVALYKQGWMMMAWPHTMKVNS